MKLFSISLFIVLALPSLYAFQAHDQNIAYTHPAIVVSSSVSYISVQNVPAGTTITSTTYWTPLLGTAPSTDPGTPPTTEPDTSDSDLGNLTPPEDEDVSSKLINISTRGYVGTGNDVMIAGFVIDGDATATKKVMIAVTSGGLDDNLDNDFITLKNPELTLRDSTGAELARNDDWITNTDVNKTYITSSGSPSTEKEPALVMDLRPGAYTAIVSGVENTTGVTIVGVNDLGDDGGTGSSRLLNISTRGKVLTGDRAMIAGFVISSNSNGGSLRVKMSNNGASLGDNPSANFYTLKDPNLQLVGGEGDSNDNWADRPDEELSYLYSNNQQPDDSRESFLLKTLNPGAYTLIMRGASSQTGIAVVGVTIAD